MNSAALLPAAYLLDQIAGDPEWLPHPVRLMGATITRGEALFRRPGQSWLTELASGAALTFSLVTVTYCITDGIIRRAYRSSNTFGTFSELVLAWTCLAARNLEQEATAVVDALTSGDLRLARRRLSRIVGRDTGHLDQREISRALIETVAESASDGIIAPLFYMAIGGVPLAMAYKAVNTLDSMIGHTDANYFYFGKGAARLDDAANFLPARLTALGIIAACYLRKEADPTSARQTWQRDGARHKSPNAGQPESAMAGALQVRLGGENTYAGELLSTPVIGQEFPPPTLVEVRQAIRLVATVSLAGVLLGALLRTVLARRPA